MKYILLLIMLVTILSGCEKNYKVKNMEFIKTESSSKYYDIAYFKNKANETFKFYLDKDYLKMMTVNQLYNITYTNDSTGTIFDNRNYTIIKIDPSNLNNGE